MNDELLRELKEALDVKPSPEFVAKLRRGVEADRSQWRWPVRVMATLGTAAFLIGVVGMWTIGRETIPAANPKPVNASGQMVEGSRQPMPSPATVIEERSAVRSPARRAPQVPAVLVPDDQRRAVARLLANIRTGRSVSLPSAPSLFDAEGNLLPLEPVVVEPVRIERLPSMAIDDDSGGVGETRSEL